MRQLYALKQDLDMIVTDIKELKTGYVSVDEIAKNFERLWQEHLFQSRQMGRMEDDIRQMKGQIAELENRLTELENRLTKLENRLTKLENGLVKVENQISDLNQKFYGLNKKFDGLNQKTSLLLANMDKILLHLKIT